MNKILHNISNRIENINNVENRKERLDSWSKIQTNDKNLIARKTVDYSTFSKGTTIPTRYHKCFLENISETLVRGKQIKIKIFINNVAYDSSIRSPKFKDRKDIVIQLQFNKKLKDLLAKELSVSYDYIMKNKDENTKTQVKVPDEYKEYMDFYKGDKKDTFIVKLIKQNSIDDENAEQDDDIESEDIYEVVESVDEDKIINKIEVKSTVEYIHNYIKEQGYTYDKSLIKNLYISLKTKPFVILSGISGTGKSKIVELFAKAIGATTENKRFNLIPVKPDWSDSTDLLGFRNIEGKFTPGVITKVCYEAMMNPELPYFICLDEMNLARAEYYFSDILSLMETRRVNEDNEIITNILLSKEQIGRDASSISTYGDVYIPQNLYIVGTVNMDETTFSFSKKVLDRANTIEFNKVNLNYYFDDEDKSNGSLEGDSDNKSEELSIYHNNLLKSEFLKIKDCKEYKEIAQGVIKKLIEINDILEKYNCHFGYRVRDEITFYIIYATKDKLMTFGEAFDICVVQKILPKISGSSNETLEILLCLFELFNKYKISNKEYIEEKELKAMEIKAKETFDNANDVNSGYKLTNEKLIYMIRRFIRDGFTTFWQ